jgi:hypothetical protein
MIVNPQLFKNKIASSFAITSVALIFVYGIFSYSSLQVEQNQLQKENKVLETELSVMIDKFDDAQEEKQDLSENYLEIKDSISATASMVESLKTELSILPKYQQEVVSFVKKNTSLVNENEALENETQILKDKADQAAKALVEEKKENIKLKRETSLLKKAVKKDKIVKEASFKANAMSASFLGKKTMTSKASKAKIIEVEFSLEANMGIDSGEKTFYIQVIGPDNNIVSDQGVVKFGNSQLIYSHKKVLEYTNEILLVKTKIKNKKSFKKGTYFINIFHKDQRVGGTKILLN